MSTCKPIYKLQKEKKLIIFSTHFMSRAKVTIFKITCKETHWPRYMDYYSYNYTNNIISTRDLCDFESGTENIMMGRKLF